MAGETVSSLAGRARVERPSPSAELTGAELEQAQAAACDFLLRGQSEDGAWRDFSTEPGVADAWTTAYVGLCLLAMSKPADGRRSALRRAASWLGGRRDRFDGWGYNSRCPPDADSTAHAILFLRHCGLEVPIEAYARLLSFARPDGGFTTYLSAGGADSWSISHPCVTPVALHALLTCLPPDDRRLGPCLESIRSGQTPGGFWHSFWWRSELYGTAVNLEAVLELELDFDRGSLVAHLEALEPSSAFELALLARCQGLLGEARSAEKVINSLLRLQQADGGWPSEPMLRVTRRSCFEPWHDADPGPLHGDQERLFTTATALRSVAEWHSQVRRPSHATTS